MYVRGFFKLGHIPTALSGVLLLAASFVTGYVHVRYSDKTASYHRSELASGYMVTEGYAQALNIMYLANCVAVAIAIFHAGAFPLYKFNSSRRFKHTLQDSFASFGWSFLSLHHASNIIILGLLTIGPNWTATLAPAVLMLPAVHFAMRLFPQIPPKVHYWLGLGWDSTHFPLLGLYLYRIAKYSPWEAYGVLAEALHVISILPEYFVQHRSAQELENFESFTSPFGRQRNDPDAPGAASASVETTDLYSASRPSCDNLSADAMDQAEPKHDDQPTDHTASHPHLSNADGVGTSKSSSNVMPKTIVSLQASSWTVGNPLYTPAGNQGTQYAAQQRHKVLGGRVCFPDGDAYAVGRVAASSHVERSGPSMQLSKMAEEGKCTPAPSSSSNAQKQQQQQQQQQQQKYEKEQEETQVSSSGGDSSASAKPVFPLLVLINCISFFFFGGMVAFQP